MRYIKTDKGWLKTKNEADKFYVLDRGGICMKQSVTETYDIEIEPMEMLIILLSKGVNITKEIAGNGFTQYLETVKNCDYNYVLTKHEFEATKALHNEILKRKG